jgi:hypothetical protein
MRDADVFQRRESCAFASSGRGKEPRTLHGMCPPKRSGDPPMTDVIEALDTVVLTTDLPAYHLQAGDVGTVIIVHRHGGYEVKFATLDGETVAEVTLSLDQVRPVGPREIAHVRAVPTA